MTNPQTTRQPMINKPKHSIVDCYNDRMMVAEGLRVKPLNINYGEFRKTPEEKASLSTAKSAYKKSKLNQSL